MYNIDEYLNKIKSAVYGEEVRGSIIKSLEIVNGNMNEQEELSQKVDRQLAELDLSIESKADNQIGRINLAGESVQRKTDELVKKIQEVDVAVSKINEVEANKIIQKADELQLSLENAKQILDQKNLCLESNETKKGNDLYFNTKELQANKIYIVEFEITEGDQSELQNGYIYKNKLPTPNPVVKKGKNRTKALFDSNQTNINIYKIGSTAVVTNVRVYEMDEDIIKINTSIDDLKNKYISLEQGITNQIESALNTIHNIDIPDETKRLFKEQGWRD